MSLAIRPADGSVDCSYGQVIADFLGQEFGASLETPAQLLDMISGQFTSTSQNRQGSLPKPEGLVAVRKVISYWVDKGEPIAVLVPWGSKKAMNGKSVDVAELFALRQLMALRNRVAKAYAPGLMINLGIEDLGGQFLWQDVESRIESAKYVRDFVKLVGVMDAAYINAKPESEIVEYETFAEKAWQMAELLEPYIKLKVNGGMLAQIDRQLTWIQEKGWKGDIPLAQIQFYLNSYEKYYPNQSMDQNIQMISRYLGQSWARYEVGAKLAYPSWGENYVQINFPQPVPGVPASLADRRLYCRTLPMRFSRTHIPPWRARGWVQIDEKDGVVPKLSSFATPPWDDEFENFSVVLSNGREVVEVSCPYKLTNNTNEMSGLYMMGGV